MIEEKTEVPFNEETLEECIGDISDVHGCIACGFFLGEKPLKVSKKGEGTEYEVIFARAGDIVLTAKKVAEDLLTELGIITIELSGKKIIIVPVDRLTLAVLTKKDINLGMLRLVIARCIEKIEAADETQEEESPEEVGLAGIEELDIDTDGLKLLLEKEGLTHLMGDELPEPVVNEPVAEEPLTVGPVVEEPIVEEPVVEEPVMEEPAIENLLTEQPIIEEPGKVESVVEEPVPKKPISEEHPIDEPKIGEPSQMVFPSIIEDTVREIITRFATENDLKIRKLQVVVGKELNVELHCHFGFRYNESKINEIKSSIEKRILEGLSEKGVDTQLNLVVKNVF